MGSASAWLRRLCAAGIAALGVALLPAAASASGLPADITNTATDSFGLTFSYHIQVPAGWNGTLVLYSHGYSFSPSPATDAGDPVTGAWLLGHGYAIAGSSYSTSGWALQQAFADQIQTLDIFDDTIGTPTRTIAWGHSLGGMITAGLVQLFPDRFAGAIPMCGVVAGGPGVWNQGLDSEFALNTLQFSTPVKLTNFTSLSDAANNFGLASAELAAAQTTSTGQPNLQGRARIALSAALADVPGWFDPTSAEPAPNDFAAQEANQVLWDNNPDFAFAFFGRLELEARAGGNFSWNTGVDYRVQLSHSVDFAEVQALYAAAGLDLNKDLQKLNAADRISADPNAVAYLSKYITYNGNLAIPVLSMHTTGDGLVEVTDENTYASVVRSAGDNSMLRQVFVHRAGHCTFTPAETVTAFQTLINRLDTGHWIGPSVADLNANASSLGSDFNVLVVKAGPPLVVIPGIGPSFVDFHPDKFLRPFDARDAG
jgi:pimeloyl-ACP methyl ester carboxylesterase